MQSSLTVLVTGFEPFGRDTINPSLEVARKLHGRTIAQATVYGAKLPVVFGKASAQAIDAIEQVQPDIVISLGLHHSRNTLGIERVGINLRDGGPDNAGVTLEDNPIIEGGPNAYFATLPIKAVLKQLAHWGIPAKISNTAGTYCCNEVMYAILHHTVTHHLDTMCGFIHVPRLPVQDVRRARSCCMELNVIVQGVEMAIQVSAQKLINDSTRRVRYRSRRQINLERPPIYS